MVIKVFDKSVDVEDYEIIVKNTKEGKLLISISYENVFSIEFSEQDTKRLNDTMFSALKVLSSTQCHTEDLQQAINLYKTVVVEPTVSGCRK